VALYSGVAAFAEVCCYFVKPLVNALSKFLHFGRRLFGLAVSVWPIRSGRFGLAVSVTGHFGQTMKSCRNLTLMQRRPVWFKAYSLHHIVSCERMRHSTQTPFTIHNSGKRCRQGNLLGIKFLVFLQSN